jgi:hypothetical protein
MAFTKSADGIAKQGKTKGKNLGDSGPTVMGRNGGTKNLGVTSKAMKAVGRNLARVANQKSGSRGR